MDDIDLFSGGISEPVFDGGLVGETFSEMMGMQFQRVKLGDRFFFDNERHFSGFSDREFSRTSVIVHFITLSQIYP